MEAAGPGAISDIVGRLTLSAVQTRNSDDQLRDPIIVKIFRHQRGPQKPCATTCDLYVGIFCVKSCSRCKRFRSYKKNINSSSVPSAILASSNHHIIIPIPVHIPHRHGSSEAIAIILPDEFYRITVEINLQRIITVRVEAGQSLLGARMDVGLVVVAVVSPRLRE